jgi:dihydropteroate synthase
VSVTNGSATVTGVGTYFLSEFTNAVATSALAGTVAVGTDGVITGVGTSFTTGADGSVNRLQVGDSVLIGSAYFVIATVTNDTTASVVVAPGVAIGAGATIVNDVSGGLADPKMAPLIASNSTIQYVVMHWRGHSKDMQKAAEYQSVVSEVKDELEERVIALTKSGVLPEQIVLDPGIGFAKSSEHNWELLKNIDRLNLLGFPLLVGVSRKKFLGDLLGASVADDRESASIALTTYLAKSGVWGVRTHSVKPHRDAIAVVEEMRK